MGEERKSRLTLYIFAAIVLAVLAALLLPHRAMKLEVGGEIFLRLLKMMGKRPACPWCLVGAEAASGWGLWPW
jgi:hypothetical protein